MVETVRTAPPPPTAPAAAPPAPPVPVPGPPRRRLRDRFLRVLPFTDNLVSVVAGLLAIATFAAIMKSSISSRARFFRVTSMSTTSPPDDVTGRASIVSRSSAPRS